MTLSTTASLTVTGNVFHASSNEHGQFAELLAEAKALAEKIKNMRVLVDQHRIAHWGLLRPLLKRKAVLYRALTAALDQRLDQGGLTAKQQRLIKRIICRRAKELALQGDEVMRAIHDKHSEDTLTEIEKAQAADAQAYFEQMMGEELDEAEGFDNVDDVLHASIERMRKQAEARAQAKEKRKKRSGKGGKSAGTDLASFDTQNALRAIYRQLASALHPDRETDPEARLHKTNLMSEANTAYGRGDLLTLLELQLQANLDEEQIASSMTADKVYALTSLMQDRVQTLQRELRDVELEAVAEFVLPSALSIRPNTLKAHLTKQQRDLQSSITGLKSDLIDIANSTTLKRWLRDQEELI